MGLVLDEPKENETTTSINGVDLLVSPDMVSYADDSVVDYRNSWYGRGFTVQSRAGC